MKVRDVFKRTRNTFCLKEISRLLLKKTIVYSNSRTLTKLKENRIVRTLLTLKKFILIK
jgi:hypothetical protein